MTNTKSDDVEVALEPQYDIAPAEREPQRDLPERRPYKFTAEARRKILVALQMGHFAENAAAYGGITKRTFMDWIQRGIEAGPEGTGIEKEFFEFAQLCTEARANSKIGLVAIAWRHAREDGKVAIALMEKLFPEEYGRRTTQEVKGKVEHEHSSKPDYSQLSDTELDQLEVLAKKARREQIKDEVIDAEILE